MRANWTAEELKILNELKGNHTPAEIAKVIIGKSRSAISARLSRDRVKASNPSEQPEKKEHSAKKSDKTEEDTCEHIAEIIPFKKPVFLTPVRTHPLDKIGARDCRWPFGTPGHADFAFCGEKISGVGPYCAEHTKKAFTPGNISKAVRL